MFPARRLNRLWATYRKGFAMGYALLAIGGILLLVGGIWLIVTAFQVSVPWGLGCFFCGPIVPLIFVIMYWDRAAKPFLTYIVGWVFAVIGYKMVM
jgi:hypothetical protein